MHGGNTNSGLHHHIQTGNIHNICRHLSAKYTDAINDPELTQRSRRDCPD
jgi:hypothetical protein